MLRRYARRPPQDSRVVYTNRDTWQALVRIPDHLTYEQASTLPCAAVTAYSCLQGPVPLKGGDVVLIQGTGGVSMYVLLSTRTTFRVLTVLLRFGLQLAKAMGATIIATSSSNEKLEFARKLGAEYTINYRENPDWEQEVLKIVRYKNLFNRQLSLTNLQRRPMEKASIISLKWEVQAHY